jgi:hypothetical protein
MCKHNFEFDSFLDAKGGYSEKWTCRKCGRVESRKSGPISILLVLVLIAAIAVMIMGFLV